MKELYAWLRNDRFQMGYFGKKIIKIFELHI